MAAMLRGLVTSTARAALRRNMATLRQTTKERAVNLDVISHMSRNKNEVILVEAFRTDRGCRCQHKLTFASEDDARGWMGFEGMIRSLKWPLSHTVGWWQGVGCDA